MNTLHSTSVAPYQAEYLTTPTHTPQTTEPLAIFKQHFVQHKNIFANADLLYVTNQDFADANNLVLSTDPTFTPGLFIPGKGQAYSSWETSRHQNPYAKDFAIFKLNTPSQIGAFCLSTEFHDGNHAPQSQVWGCSLHDGEIPNEPDEKFWLAQHWIPLSPRLDLKGHAKHYYQPPADNQSFTHFRLDNIPDGGISRIAATSAATALAPNSLQVDTALPPIPALSAYNDQPHTKSGNGAYSIIYDLKPGVTCNLVSNTLGGKILATSDHRFSESPERILSEESPIDMGDGIETSRQRLNNNTMKWHYTILKPGVLGKATQLTCDYAHFVYNTPVMIQLLGWNEDDRGNGHWELLLDTVRVKEHSQDQFTADIPSPKQCTMYAYGFFPCGGTHRINITGNYAGKADKNSSLTTMKFDQAVQQLQPVLSRDIERDIQNISRRQIS